MNILLEINTLDFFLRLLGFTIPAIVVFVVTYLTLRKFLEEDYKKKLLELRIESRAELTPLKLQAYERLTILMERLKPDALIMRLSDPAMNAIEFKSLLERTVKEEFAHNVAQQIYVSNQAWSIITRVIENLLTEINNAYKDMNENSTALDLGKAILSDLIKRNDQSNKEAIDFLKKEIELVL